MNRIFFFVALSFGLGGLVTAFATTFGTSSNYQGLFEPHRTPSAAQPTGPLPGEPPASTGPGLKNYALGLNRVDATILAQLQKYTLQTGTSLGELTTKHHIQAARCLIPGAGQADPTAKVAHKCLERAATDFNRVLLSARFPDYASALEPDAGTDAIGH
jgi:hypothetical protein